VWTAVTGTASPDGLTTLIALLVTGAVGTLAAIVLFRASGPPGAGSRAARPDLGFLGAAGANRPHGEGTRMRIYEGSPRQEFEEVFRSIGGFLDERHMREILITEVPEGFMVQGLVAAGDQGGTWSEAVGTVVKETLTFVDDDIARFMDEAVSRRGTAVAGAPRAAGAYEAALRIIGRWLDEQKPRDVFLFEQGGAYVVRLMLSTQHGAGHELVEFTLDDIGRMAAVGPKLRVPPRKPAS